MSSQIFEGKRILVTGGTGTIGQALVKRLLQGKSGRPKKVIVFSRDENKQYLMRATSSEYDVCYDFQNVLEFQLGDIRDYNRVVSALRNVDIVFNAAAMKQAPNCEYFPYEAIMTNTHGPENIVRAIEQFNLPVKIVVGISTDKACCPTNVMGMTKALQERIFIQANIRCPNTRFVCVRYGNVVSSRGSVVPLFQRQIFNGGPVMVTSAEMTRFLISLDGAVDTAIAAANYANRGEILVPNLKSALTINVAKALIEMESEREIEIAYIGVRPGEKIHEDMVSDEETTRPVLNATWLAICPVLPELAISYNGSTVVGPGYEFSKKRVNSADCVMSYEETRDMLIGCKV